MATKRDVLKYTSRSLAGRFEPRHGDFRAVIKEKNGSTRSPRQPNKTWIAKNNQPEGWTLVFNGTALDEPETPVWVGPMAFPPHQLEIKAPYTAALPPNTTVDVGRFQTTKHVNNHMTPTEATEGPDPLLVYGPMFGELLTTGNDTDLDVTTQGIKYMFDGNIRRYGGQITDLTSYVPAAGLTVKILVYLDEPTNTLKVLSGTAVATGGVLPPSEPQVPVSGRPSCFVTLVAAQTSITTATSIEHFRDTQRARLPADDPDLDAGFLESQFTGLYNGGQMSLDTVTTIDVTGGEGVTVDVTTDPQHPAVTEVAWSVKLGVTVPNLGTNGENYIFLDSNGDLVFQTSMTPDDRRDKIFLGVTINDMIASEILDVVPAPTVVNSLGGLIYDFFHYTQWRFGGLVSPNADLTVETSALNFFVPGINFFTDPTDPNHVTIAGDDPLEHYRMDSDGLTTGTLVTNIDVANYESPLGTIAAVPGATTRATIFRVVLEYPNYAILYGQQWYNDLEAAVAATELDEAAHTYPSDIDETNLVAYIIAISGATDLSDSTDALIDNVDVGAGGGGSGGGGSGDVVGPASATNNAIARYDSTTGKLIQDSTATISDSGFFQATIADAVTSIASIVARLSHNTSGTPTTGFGTTVLIRAESSTTPNTIIGAIKWAWANATHALRASYVSLWAATTAGDVEMARFTADPNSQTPGNARGDYSVDLLGERNAATQVASGNNSVIGGGRQNTASGEFSVVPGGNDGIASGQGAVAINGEAAGDYSAAFSFGKAANDSQFAIGSAGVFNLVGDSQASNTVLVTEETHGSSTWRRLFTEGVGNHANIAADTVWVFDIQLVGTTSGATKSFGWKMHGVLENDGGTTSMLFSSISPLYDLDDVSFDARVIADDTNDAIQIEVMDADAGGDTVRWVAAMRTVEVTFP